MSGKFNSIDLLLVIIFMLPIVLGFVNKFNSYDSKQEVYGFEKNIILLIAGITCLFWADRGTVINQVMDALRKNSVLASFADSFPKLFFFLVFFIVLAVLYYTLKLIVYAVNNVVIFPLLDGVDSFSRRRGSLVGSVLGALFSIPKSIIYIIIVCFVLSFIPFKIGGLSVSDSNIYDMVQKKAIDPIKNSSIVSQLPRLLNNSLKIKVVNEDNINQSENSEGVVPGNGRNVIVYYNGVTLDQGIKSNDEINSKAAQITSGKSDSRSKALAIYKWIGSNITYDDNKASSVLGGQSVKNSGAIPAFNEKKGICFDYACLFVAMCRSQGLKVRVITGEGFNGYQWVSHAWNQVYIPEAGEWINVDPTFAVAGNYFDNKNFYRDHKQKQVAGQW